MAAAIRTLRPIERRADRGPTRTARTILHQDAPPRSTGTPDRALYLVRDGRDSLVSQTHQVTNRDLKKFRGLSYDARMARLIAVGIRAHGTWSDNVRTWRNRSAPTAILRFEELIVDPVSTIARGREELSVPLPEVTGEVPSFEELHRVSDHLYRRGTVGSWRDEMPPRLHGRFWRLHGEEMVALGDTDGRPHQNDRPHT